MGSPAMSRSARTRVAVSSLRFGGRVSFERPGTAWSTMASSARSFSSVSEIAELLEEREIQRAPYARFDYAMLNERERLTAIRRLAQAL